jgi:hypothetical protein
VLIAAAVCPHPPLLVPEMAGGAAPELDGLRAACDEAVGRLRLPVVTTAAPEPVPADAPDLLVVVGGHEETRRFGHDAYPDGYASLRPYGLDWTLASLTWGETEELPLSLTMGYWLLHRALGGSGRILVVPNVWLQAVAFDAPPAACAALGHELAAAGDRVALLVMGDGSACRTEKAPGYLDERAQPYDAEVVRALGHADAAALAALDPELSSELLVAGRAAWQVLAGAAGENGRANGVSGDVLADEAPYGVGYVVASWSRSRRAIRPGRSAGSPG